MTSAVPWPRTESSASGAVVSKVVNSLSEKQIDGIHVNAISMTRVCVLAEWSSDCSVRFKLAAHSSQTLKFSNI